VPKCTNQVRNLPSIANLDSGQLASRLGLGLNSDSGLFRPIFRVLVFLSEVIKGDYHVISFGAYKDSNKVKHLRCVIFSGSLRQTLMPVNAVAENVFGTMGKTPHLVHDHHTFTVLSLTGTIFWSVQLIPQIFKSWRTKSTEGLSPWLVYVPPPIPSLLRALTCRTEPQTHVEHIGAPIRHLRDRTRPQHPTNRPAPTFRAPHSPLVDAMHVLFP
jgi:hypothetical protein